MEQYAIPSPVTRPKRGDGNKSGTAAPSPSDGTVKSPGKASNSLSKEYSAYNTWQAEVSQEPYRLFVSIFICMQQYVVCVGGGGGVRGCFVWVHVCVCVCVCVGRGGGHMCVYSFQITFYNVWH